MLAAMIGMNFYCQFNYTGEYFSTLVNVEKHLPSMCLTVCEESSQRPVWTATMLAVMEEPVMSPTDDTLCPACSSTCPFICTENTSGSEFIPTRCTLTGA